jgi:BirA family biotin operon repressor/biotin-[acetyl-CoA-carboxylase] ligase
MGSGFELGRLRAELRPLRLYWFPRLRSTNDHAAEMRRRGELFAPAAVLTGRQTAGRGRGTNTWWSGEGSLTVTFAMPVEEHLATHQLPLVAGLAVRSALAGLCGDGAVGLKWPNDVVYEGRKLAGLLCERVHRIDLIGVGVNLNVEEDRAPAELQGRITSVYAIAGRRIDPTTALAAIARHLVRTLRGRKERPFGGLLKEYDRHHDLVGRRVTVRVGGEGEPISGQCEGLDEQGRLMVRDRGGVQRILTGSVEMM